MHSQSILSTLSGEWIRMFACRGQYMLCVCLSMREREHGAHFVSTLI